MVSNRAWPLSSHGNWWINWKLTQIKPNSSFSETNGCEALISPCFLLNFFMSNEPCKIWLESCWSKFWQKMSPSVHMYLQSTAHAFTTSGISSVLALTLISLWIVQNYLQMPLCLAVSIIVLSSVDLRCQTCIDSGHNHIIVITVDGGKWYQKKVNETLASLTTFSTTQ